MNEQQLRDLLRDLRDEPVPADSRARVRQAVTARIARPRVWWKPGLLAAAAVAGAVVVAILWPAAEEPAPTAPVVASRPEPAPAVPEAPPVPEAQPARVSVPAADAPPAPAPRKPKPARPPVVNPEPEFITTASPPMTIRIETADPEVVILLVN